jgi:polysaccharide pyruvyl transferase WcaK-like protein
MARGSSGPSAATVIVQTGSNDLDNLGDLAMLEVLIDRIRERNRGVSFSVFARNSEKVKSLGGDVRQVAVEQKAEWAFARQAYLGARRFVPATDSMLRHGFPSLYRSLIRSKARSLANSETIASAKMLVVSGGGFLNDVFPGQAWPVFERLRAAIESRTPFALMGQGLGPLRDPALVAIAKSVLPHAELIAVRELVYSLPLLLELGVSRDRIVVTGDDAIEPAYRARSETQGTNIGVNLRIADYAGTTRADITTLYSTLRELAHRNSARLIALPVCIADSADTVSDARVIGEILGVGDTGRTSEAPITTSTLIDRFADCRVVVTGSYHAAVFALSQGIPAACLFASEYYEMKFRGLRAQFGDGCQLIDMRTPEFEIQLDKIVGELLRSIGTVKPTLLAAAEKQIEDGLRAYDRLSVILGSAA